MFIIEVKKRKNMKKDDNNAHQRFFSRFWNRFRIEPISASAGLLYFYLLEKISGNGWRAISVTDVDLSATLKIGRNKLPKYREVLKQHGLIEFAKDMSEYRAGIIYSIPGQSASFDAHDCSEKCRCAIDLPEKIERSSADDFLERRRIASEQGEELLRAFFDPSGRRSIEVLCMQNRITEEELRGLANRIVNDWILEGRTHEKFGGGFDLCEALRHLRMSIPKRLLSERSVCKMPMSRDDKRMLLMQTSFDNLQRAIVNDHKNNPH